IGVYDESNIQHGKFIIYYGFQYGFPSDQSTVFGTMVTLTFDHGIKIKEEKRYYPNGDLSEVASYKNRDLSEVASYKNGDLSKVASYENGDLSKVASYENGLLHGRYVEYNVKIKKESDKLPKSKLKMKKMIDRQMKKHSNKLNKDQIKNKSKKYHFSTRSKF